MAMKKVVSTLLFAAFLVSCAFAETALFTGKDWAGFTKTQKVDAVTTFIEEVKKQGVTVTGEAGFYCSKVDTFYAANPQVMTEPVGKTLKTIMIMEYDWEIKGMDKDTIARNWLGEDLYNANKKRMKSQGK